MDFNQLPVILFVAIAMRTAKKIIKSHHVYDFVEKNINQLVITAKFAPQTSLSNVYDAKNIREKVLSGVCKIELKSTYYRSI